MSKNLLYTVSFGGEKQFEICKLFVYIARNIGNYKGDIIVFTDKKQKVPGATNIVIDSSNFKKKDFYIFRAKINEYVDIKNWKNIGYCDYDVAVLDNVFYIFEKIEKNKIILFQEPVFINEGYPKRNTQTCFLDYDEIFDDKTNNFGVNSGQFFVSSKYANYIFNKWKFIFYQGNKKNYYDQAALQAMLLRKVLDYKYMNGNLIFPTFYKKDKYFNNWNNLKLAHFYAESISNKILYFKKIIMLYEKYPKITKKQLITHVIDLKNNVTIHNINYNKIKKENISILNRIKKIAECEIIE